MSWCFTVPQRSVGNTRRLMTFQYVKELVIVTCRPVMSSCHCRLNDCKRSHIYTLHPPSRQLLMHAFMLTASGAKSNVTV